MGLCFGNFPHLFQRGSCYNLLCFLTESIVIGLLNMVASSAKTGAVLTVLGSIEIITRLVLEVVLLQGLITSKGGGQAGIQGPLDVHALSEVDQGGKSCNSDHIVPLLHRQLLYQKLLIIWRVAQRLLDSHRLVYP